MEQYDSIMENQPPGSDIKDVVKNSDDRGNMTHRAFGTGQPFYN